jgi:hypothetical protein
VHRPGLLNKRLLVVEGSDVTGPMSFVIYRFRPFYGAIVGDHSGTGRFRCGRSTGFVALGSGDAFVLKDADYDAAILGLAFGGFVGVYLR